MDIPTLQNDAQSNPCLKFKLIHHISKMSFLVNALKSHHNGTEVSPGKAQSSSNKFSSGKGDARAQVRAIYMSNTSEPITCHAFNASANLVAISRNSNDVDILQVPTNLQSSQVNAATFSRKSGASNGAVSASGSWPVVSTLNAHDLRVTGIDWAPKSNRIVTCSADRNAYVWTPDTANGANSWKKTLVLLRTNRAATCVKWSPLENKFAVGCGSKLVSVCYFDEENDWWLSKHIKKPLKSTVTCVDWHSNNLFLAVGSSDFRARVYSAYVRDVDAKPDPKDAPTTRWGDNFQWGNVMAEYLSSCWIHDIRFCAHAKGDRLLWIAHDCTLNIVDAAQSIQHVITCRTKYLPFYTVQWLSSSMIIAAGHDCAPHLYMYDAARIDSSRVGASKQAIVHFGTLDRPATLGDDMDDGSTTNGEHPEERTNMSALKKFRDLDLKATSDADDTSLLSLHQNTITQLSVLGSSGSSDKSSITFATSGQDGMLIMWQLAL